MFILGFIILSIAPPDSICGSGADTGAGAGVATGAGAGATSGVAGAGASIYFSFFIDIKINANPTIPPNPA